MNLSALISCHTQTTISPQGLHSRLNNLMQDTLFSRIRVMDATAFILPPIFRQYYKGSGGTRHTSGAKIQLEYDLLNGKILQVYLGEEKENDCTFSVTHPPKILPGDLCIRDLGYFDLTEFQRINQMDGYYISRVKTTTKLAVKNPEPERFERNGNIKKHSAYVDLDMTQYLTILKPGETIELPEVYCGRERLLGTRLIIHRLTNKEFKKREAQLERMAKKRKHLSEKSKKLKELNVYITNYPVQWVETEQVYSLYSLRWQIELLFKIWKSTFQINQIKKVNIHRLNCHFYGQLIAILLTSTMMFRLRLLLYHKFRKELSEQKAMAVLKKYLPQIYLRSQNSTEEIYRFLIQLL